MIIWYKLEAFLTQALKLWEVTNVHLRDIVKALQHAHDLKYPE